MSGGERHAIPSREKRSTCLFGRLLPSRYQAAPGDGCSKPETEETNMTTAMRLTGPWEGLRAYPRGFRTPDSRQCMEAALERLQHHRERFDRHINRAQSAIDRINALCDDAIARLDASDPDADLEPQGDDEPSLCGVNVGGGFFSYDDREHSADDVGEPSLGSGPGMDQSAGKWLAGCRASDHEAEHDGREPCVDGEASLSGTLGLDAHAVGAGLAGIGSFGETTFDLEGEHDGREPEEDNDRSDYEPDQDEECRWADEGDQTHLKVLPVAPKRIAKSLRHIPSNIAGPAIPEFGPNGWVFPDGCVGVKISNGATR